MNTFTDETLTAFLDGELSEEQMQEITRALVSDRGLQARVANLQVDFAPIKDAFDELLTNAPVDHIVDNIKTPHTATTPNNSNHLTQTKAKNDVSWLQYAAAACVVLATGFGLGRFSAEAPSPAVAKITWKGEVARYQKLFTKETLAPFKPTAAVAQQQMTNVIQTLKMNVSASQLMQDGLDFKRAQMLAFNEKPLAQFMYQDQDGTPIAICILASAGDDKKLSLANIKGLNSASWKKNGFAYILIGDTNADRIKDLANRAIAKI